MDRSPFATNQSIACLGRMVVLVLLPVMWFIFFYLRVSFFVLCNLGANSPSTPLPGRETVYIVHDCHGRGEYLFFTATFCSFVRHSRSFLLLCCFPAACLLLSAFLLRRARPRHIFNHRLRRRIFSRSYMLMHLLISACFLARFIV